MENIISKTFVLVSMLALVVGCAQGSSNYTGSGSNQPSEVGCGSMQGTECDMFVAINQYRSTQGLPAYNSLQRCIAMAESHASDMFTHNYLGHDSSTQTFGQRLQQFGLASASATESVARGSNSVDVILNLFKNAQADNQILLDNKSYHSIGIGFATGYWTICYSAL